MANDTLINLLAWCKRERERLQMQREMLQSGRFRIFEKDDSDQQRDISNQHIEQIAAGFHPRLQRAISGPAEPGTVTTNPTGGRRKALPSTAEIARTPASPPTNWAIT